MTSLINNTIALADRAMFKVTGSDAERYLNGQVSQDVSLASENDALYSIVASFKGKLEGDFYIRRYKGDFLIDTCGSQRDSLLARLDKYLIADDAEISDVSTEFIIYHSLTDYSLTDSEHMYPQWKCNRYGTVGVDYLIPAEESLPLGNMDFDWELERISNKIPLWGKELDENVLPAEAGLESRAISFSKGCYTGQEVISRMKSAGKVNCHLVGFTLDTKIQVPSELYASAEAEGKPGATITSICEYTGFWIGLGYRTRKAEMVNLFYDARGNKANVL